VPLCSTLPLRPLRNESKLNSVPQRLLRFHVPLTASLLESGTPGLTSPGIFRPWPFSNLRRFAPPATHLFCFTHIPPLVFKEHKRLVAFENQHCTLMNTASGTTSRTGRHQGTRKHCNRLPGSTSRPSMAKPLPPSLRRHDTHHTTCKQITQDEDTST
jgi:hypothetical protein